MENLVLFGGNISIEYLIAAGIVLLFGRGWHEYAHAVMADWWGDPTPRQNGRLTPNPIVHISWIGWLLFLIFGFGILGSVPINNRRIRDPHWGQFWTPAAGPISNLIQAIVFAIVLFAFSLFTPVNARAGISIFFFPEVGLGSFSNPVFDFLSLFFVVGVYFNVLLFFFNLIPFVIPAGIFGQMPMPFDGWTMLYSALPGEFMSYKSIPAFITKNMRPLARFLSQPAYAWRDWVNIMGYITIGLVLISLVTSRIPGAGLLDPLSLLIGRPTQQVSFLLMGFGF